MKRPPTPREEFEFRLGSDAAVVFASHLRTPAERQGAVLTLATAYVAQRVRGGQTLEHVMRDLGSAIHSMVVETLEAVDRKAQV